MQYIKTLAVLLVCILQVPAFARTDCPPPAGGQSAEQIQVALKNAEDRGFLWRISKDGHESFLYGTIHVAKFEWMFPGPRVMQALQNTDAMALELDLLDPAIPAGLAKGIQNMRITPLPESLKARISKLAESYCVPYEKLAGLPPELQIGSLVSFLGLYEGLRPEYAIDAIMAVVGHKSGKQVISLESPEFQLQQLIMPKSEDTVAMVKDELDMLDRENGLTYLMKVAKTWGDSDYSQMEDFPSWCKCMETESERSMMKRLLDERNPLMAEKIDTLHVSGKRVFAAVGSLHLFGPLGLPTLMEKRGYKIERIKLRK